MSLPSRAPRFETGKAGLKITRIARATGGNVPVKLFNEYGDASALQALCRPSRPLRPVVSFLQTYLRRVSIARNDVVGGFWELTDRDGTLAPASVASFSARISAANAVGPFSQFSPSSSTHAPTPCSLPGAQTGTVSLAVALQACLSVVSVGPRNPPPPQPPPQVEVAVAERCFAMLTPRFCFFSPPNGGVRGRLPSKASPNTRRALGADFDQLLFTTACRTARNNT